MKIIACYKLVPEEQDISIKPDRTLDISKSEPKISQFDLNAVESAAEVKAAVGEATITALSVGGKSLENSKARKDILSRGPDELTVVMDAQLDNALPFKTSAALAKAAQKVGYDLIICGDGSGDLYAQQVGLLLGEQLRVPTINAVSKIVSVSNDKVTVERTLEDEVEVLEIALPAVISVTPDINAPKIPAMKAILAAGKKPVTMLSAADIGLGDIPSLVELVAVTAPEQKERKKVIVEGDDDEKVAEFANHIRKVLN